MASERGAVLLDALVGILLLATAGLALVELAGGALRSARESGVREHRMRDIERLLAAHTLLTREDLDRRLGDRTVGPYVVNTLRPEPDLFRIQIEQIVTVVHRPRADDAP